MQRKVLFREVYCDKKEQFLNNERVSMYKRLREICNNPHLDFINHTQR